MILLRTTRGLLDQHIPTREINRVLRLPDVRERLNGRLKKNTLAALGADSTQMEPPWASMASRQKVRPMPMPRRP